MLLYKKKQLGSPQLGQQEKKGVTQEAVAVPPTVHFGGAEGTRTPDLLLAKEALSQLSYSPTSKIIIIS